MFYYDFLKGQILERFSTISSFISDTHFLNSSPSHSCHARRFHHIVTQTWVPEIGRTHVSSHHHSTCHPAFYLDSLCLRDCKLWPWLLTLNIKFDRELHDPPLFPPSGVCQSWMQRGRRGGKERCRVEVKWAHWVRNPLALKLWRGWWRRRGHRMCVSHLNEQTELLQPCIHGNHLRTNLSPCWGLLFLQRKWLKEVKVRKARTEDETDTYPLSAALLKIFLTANINGQCLTI